MSELVTVRDIQTVTTEIWMIRRQVEQTALSGAIEIGRRLTEAKELLPHGEWGKWLQEEVSFSQRTANNFMRLAAEYGDAQVSLFGGNSQALADLPYTKALQLLAVPEEEREEFAAANHVADLSSRELEKLIRERDAAQEETAQAEAARDETAKRLAAALEAQEDAAKVGAAQRSRAEVAEAKAKELEGKLERAQKKAREADAALKAARENPAIPQDAMDKLRREAEEQAAKEAAEKAEARQAELRAARDKANEDAYNAREVARQAEKDRDEARRRLALANPDAAVFATLYGQVQEDWNKLHGAWIKAAAADAATGEKLRTAARALAEKWRKEEW